jgi:integrase
VPGRVAPHIYREDEIVELLAAARCLNPLGSLRPQTFETLFGLIAAAGLRVSEALALLDADVDLSAGTLTVRQSKFGKSRRLPLHPSTVEALARYRRLRSRKVRTTAETPFFVGTRGKRLGQPLSERQVHRVFVELRDRLGWINRGAHAGPRIHDLRHSFAGAVDLPGSRQDLEHLLVPYRRARADGAGREQVRALRRGTGSRR